MLLFALLCLPIDEADIQPSFPIVGCIVYDAGAEPSAAVDVLRLPFHQEEDVIADALEPSNSVDLAPVLRRLAAWEIMRSRATIDRRTLMPAHQPPLH